MATKKFRIKKEAGIYGKWYVEDCSGKLFFADTRKEAEGLIKKVERQHNVDGFTAFAYTTDPSTGPVHVDILMVRLYHESGDGWVSTGDGWQQDTRRFTDMTPIPPEGAMFFTGAYLIGGRGKPNTLVKLLPNGVLVGGRLLSYPRNPDSSAARNAG